jgi:hypothetical protein
VKTGRLVARFGSACLELGSQQAHSKRSMNPS